MTTQSIDNLFHGEARERRERDGVRHIFVICIIYILRSWTFNKQILANQSTILNNDVNRMLTTSFGLTILRQSF